MAWAFLLYFLMKPCTDTKNRFSLMWIIVYLHLFISQIAAYTKNIPHHSIYLTRTKEMLFFAGDNEIPLCPINY
jgi:hypothetical protein